LFLAGDAATQTRSSLGKVFSHAQRTQIPLLGIDALRGLTS
jgi:hypothetical protein